MEYEEIKIGELYNVDGEKEKVIAKLDEYKIVATVDDGGIVTPWVNDELHLFKPIKEELPKEGLLVNKVGSLAYKLPDGSGYGFGYEPLSYFSKGWQFHTNGHWQPATPEQETKFIEMLKKECEKRGLFEDTKIEMHAQGYGANLNNTNCFSPTAFPTVIYNKNGQIFHKGKFATPLKEETLELVSKASLDLSKFGVEIEQKGNVLIINPIKR